MMSGHGANPIFFNKKEIEIGRPEYSLTPHPSTSDNIFFILCDNWKTLFFIKVL